MHDHRHCRIYMCAAMITNKVDDNRKGTTDNKGIATTSKNAKNKEEGTEIFSEVGKVIHFYDGRRILMDEHKFDTTIYQEKVLYNIKHVQARFSKNVCHDPSK